VPVSSVAHQMVGGLAGLFHQVVSSDQHAPSLDGTGNAGACAVACHSGLTAIHTRKAFDALMSNML